MPITSVTKDPAALTMTVVAEFPVPVRRLWDAYVDPRQIGRDVQRKPALPQDPHGILHQRQFQQRGFVL